MVVSSLMAQAMPSSGRTRPSVFMYRASAVFASCIARSKCFIGKALILGSTCSARAITALISSTGESLRDLKAASASLALM